MITAAFVGLFIAISFAEAGIMAIPILVGVLFSLGILLGLVGALIGSEGSLIFALDSLVLLVATVFLPMAIHQLFAVGHDGRVDGKVARAAMLNLAEILGRVFCYAVIAIFLVWYFDIPARHYLDRWF
jgi:fumarate reductase subunit D